MSVGVDHSSFSEVDRSPIVLPESTARDGLFPSSFVRVGILWLSSFRVEASMLSMLDFGVSSLLGVVGPDVSSSACFEVNASALACLEVGAPVLVCFEIDLSSLLGVIGHDIAFLDCLGVHTSVLVCLEA